MKIIEALERKFYKGYYIERETVDTDYEVWDMKGNLIASFSVFGKAEDYIDSLKAQPIIKYHYNELGLAF